MFSLLQVTECFNNVEIEKENLPAVERVKCPECDYILIPCIEEDDEKNIIFDNCIRWYGVGLSYLQAKDKSFKCDLCN